MSVRNTERNLPPIAGFTFADLGQVGISTTNVNVILVSYLSSPIAARRLQNYVVFVTDNGLAPTVNSYEWVFNNGVTTNITTSIGIAEFTPQNIGNLTVTVNLKNVANSTLASVTLNQQVVALNAALELKIEVDEGSFPGAAHPDTSREMLNDLRMYVNSILAGPTDDLYNKLICSIAYIQALQTPAWQRNIIVEDYARVLNTNPAAFFSSAKAGFGVCKTQPQLLAMFLINPRTTRTYIDPVIELVTGASRTLIAANNVAIETAFNLLLPNEKIDLFNLLRFPKSHFTMAKKIIDALEIRYYPGETISQTLAISNNSKRLITEYETGLIAFTSSRTLGISTFANRVFALMNNPVWAIPIAALSGTVSSGGALPPSPAMVGIPEKFPSHTFVADGVTEAGFGPGSVGFLRMAVVYHNIFAQNAQSVISFQELIHILSTAATPIARLRLVTHFGGAVTAPTPDGVIFLPFFTDQEHGDGTRDNRTKFWHFAYAVSNEQGLKAYLENEYLSFLSAGFLSQYTISPPSDAPAGSRTLTAHQIILDTLQHNSDPALVPLAIQTADPNPANVLSLIIKWASDLFMLNNMNIQLKGRNSSHLPVNISPLIKTTITNFINNKIVSLQTTSGILIAANVNALVASVSALTRNILIRPFNSGDIPLTLPDVYLDNHDALRTELAIVRTRLNNSFVDIRGCRIGQDTRMLSSLKTFFGNLGQEPFVSGPEWYQGFGHLGNLTFNSEGQVDLFFNSGHATSHFTAADVQRDYSAWSGRIGISSQLSFWSNLFNGNIFDFLTFDWRNQLPPIGIQSAKLITLSAANYSDAITIIKDIFKIPTTTGPAVADLNNFNTTYIPQVTALQTIQNAIVPLTDATPQADLQTQLTNIRTIATATSQTLAAAPSPITKNYLQSSINQLKTFLITQSGITPIFSDIKTKLLDPKSGLRYMLGIGIGLLVQSAAREGQTRLAYYTADEINAMKSWLKIHWEGPLPANAISAINALNPVGAPAVSNSGTPADPNDDIYNDSALGLFFSRLSIDHNDTQTATNPSEEFSQHIKTAP
jgi:hypothetical protein